MRLFVLLFVFTSFSFAQDLSTEEIVANMTERAETLQDASFLVTGNLIDTDGQEIPLEVNVSSLPKENVLRAEFIQPDALADNFIVIDGSDVYNYVYLTNQVSVFSLGDPEALAGLFPNSSDGKEFSFTLNLAQLFEGWNISSQGTSEGSAGKVYNLRFDNTETEDIRLKHVNVGVIDGTWVPYTISFYNADDVLVAEVTFNDVVIDSGLNAEDVRYIDPSAEVIDER